MHVTWAAAYFPLTFELKSERFVIPDSLVERLERLNFLTVLNGGDDMLSAVKSLQEGVAKWVLINLWPEYAY